MNEVFRSNRVKEVLTPDEVVFNEKGVAFKVNQLIGGLESLIFYPDISGVEIDHGLFFSTIRVIPRARPEIVIENFTKGDVQEIKRLILKRV